MKVKWAIEQAEIDKDGWVRSLHWRVTAADGQSVYGQAGLAPKEGKEPLPREDMTEKIALEWLWRVIDRKATEALLKPVEPEFEIGLPWERKDG